MESKRKNKISRKKQLTIIVALMGVIAYSGSSILYYKSTQSQLKAKDVQIQQNNKAIEELNKEKSDMQKLLDETKKQLEKQQKELDDLKKITCRYVEKHIPSNSFSNIIGVEYLDYIYNMDLTTRSYMTAYEIDEYVLKGTRLYGNGKYYIKAEQKYRVNAMFLLCLSLLESGWGTSDIAKLKNNLFGFCAYDVQTFESAMEFPSIEECISHCARYLANNYLDSKGQYYKGKSVYHVNVNYCTKSNWADKIIDLMLEQNNKIMKGR